MTYKTIFLTRLVYQKDIEIYYISRNNCIITENNSVILQYNYAGKRDDGAEFESFLVSKK